MLDTFLFIPANRKEFLAKIPLLESTYFIIDFEESISNTDKQNIYSNFSDLHISSKWYARPSIHFTNGNLETESINQVINLGFKKLILPKINSFEEFKNVFLFCNSISNHFTYILLIETPKCLLELQKILDLGGTQIEGIALGSHDFSLQMKMEHTMENIEFARQSILLYARAYNKKCIDIASMDISATHTFVEECSKAISLGYDGKFFIHPKQLESFHTTSWFTPQQIHEAKEVYNEYKKIGVENFSLISLHGRVYEKPHIERIIKILDWNKKYGNK